ncbi:MAG: Ig-like domain repeat protein [Thaumarchaeota archaeon]|nr:Ig-like domain repeat protein [Nitrososphaerota archaeon]
MRTKQQIVIVSIFFLLILNVPSQSAIPIAKTALENAEALPVKDDTQSLQSSSLVAHSDNITNLDSVTVKIVGKSKINNILGAEKVNMPHIIPFLTKDPTEYASAKQQSELKFMETVVNNAPPLSATHVTQVISSASGFEGLNEIMSGNFFPPDVQIATGPNNVLEMVNLEGEIWTKQGVSISTFPLSSFFMSGSDSLSDPKVLFDSISGRWFASILDITTNSVLIAVSSTNDPTGTWNIYSVSFGNNCPDQPILGLNDDKVLVSGNDFTNHCNGNFAGAQYFILDKSAMLAGSATVSAQSSVPDTSKFSVHPVQSLSSTPTLYMISVGSGSTNKAQLFSINGAVPSAVVTITNLTILTTHIPPHAVQPGTTSRIDTGDTRIQDAAWFQGNLWLSLNDACLPSGDTVNRACIHLTQISTSTLQVKQDFRYGASGFYYFYPALRIDGMGDLDVIFGFSSSTVFPSLAVTGQAVSDPVNTLEQSLTIKSGSASDTSGRYGDYFGAALDPSDPTLIWVAGEYHSSSFSSLNWSTFISNVKTVPSPNSTTLTLNSISPSSVPWSTSITVTGKLTNSTGSGVGGKTVSFTGTGAANLATIITNADGTFTSTGLAPNTVASGWTVQAHFAGDSILNPSDSSIMKYNTIKHRTAMSLGIVPSTVVHGGTYMVTGKLKDTIAGTFLAGRTITFTADSPITITNAVTDATGTYVVSGLIAPSLAGTYNITAHYGGESLYAASNSATKTLTVT